MFNDAPLLDQYDQGYWSFFEGNLINPYDNRSMQYREWERGFNAAYTANQHFVKRMEKDKGRAVFRSPPKPGPIDYSRTSKTYWNKRYY